MRRARTHQGLGVQCTQLLERKRKNLGRSGSHFALLKALPAKHWTSLRRLERHGGFPLAPGADRFGFNSLVIAAILWQSQGLGPFAFAVFAAFWFVLELFIVKEELFASSEDEVGATVYTLENLVLELH
jgi:hypothetical protein